MLFSQNLPQEYCSTLYISICYYSKNLDNGPRGLKHVGDKYRQLETFSQIQCMFLVLNSVI